MPDMHMFVCFFYRLIRDCLMTRVHHSKDLQVVKKLAMKLVEGEGEFQAKGIIDVTQGSE